MRFTTMQEAIDYLMATRRAQNKGGLDENTRNLSPTRNLLLATNALADTMREYCVVTGSKGKGSTAIITAKLLESLGHKTGLITSPHLRHWNERIRIDGQAIPDEDFVRILNDLAPFIDAEIAKFEGAQYLSPQGIFLLIALRWWDEQGVTAAVLEVGRGGRYDDISLVPNLVSLITPIFMEHARYLGNSLERIAWHKAGIIKEGSFVYTVAQDPVVLETLQREADAKSAEFFWFSALDIGEHLEDSLNGIRFRLGRYGELEMPLLGHYEIQNATLAIQAVGNMHGRLKGLPHGSPEYLAAIQRGLSSLKINGRLQKLQDKPPVYVDGAINVLSAKDFLKSMESRITKPLITVLAVPQDRNLEGVYQIYAEVSDALIITKSDIHPNMPFPEAEQALELGRRFHQDVQFAPTLSEALSLAYEKAGETGSVLLAVAQPLVGEAMLLWDIETLKI